MTNISTSNATHRGTRKALFDLNPNTTSMQCGVDEAGRGPVLGPMVVAGVMLEDIDELVALEVKDSKRHTPNARERLAERIKAICQYELLRISADEIDAKRKTCTMNEIEVMAFSTILDKLRPTIAFADCPDVDTHRFRTDVLNNLDFELVLVAEHKADDKYPIVSAASVLAKVTRDEAIEAIQRELGTEIGSGYPSDVRTRAFLKRWVEEHNELPPYTRRSWKTVKAFRPSQKKLTDEF